MGSSLVVTQKVLAPPEDVFASWSTSEEMAKWWWPQISDTEYEVEAREGGPFRTESEAMGFGVVGEFVSVDPPNGFTLTWRWANQGQVAVEEPVHVRFTPTDGGTLVEVTHELADIAGEGDDIRQGWTDVLQRLAELYS